MVWSGLAKTYNFHFLLLCSMFWFSSPEPELINDFFFKLDTLCLLKNFMFVMQKESSVQVLL